VPLIQRPQTVLAVLCAALLASTAAADPVAVAPAPDVAGRNSGAALTKAVAHALEKAGVHVVSPALAAGRAKAAKIAWNPKLTSDAAATLAQSNHWAGVVVFSGGKKKVTVRLIDSGGQPAVTQVIGIVKKHPYPDDITGLAKSIGSLLAASQPQAPPPPPPAPAPEPTPAAAPPPPEGAVTEAAPATPAPVPVEAAPADEGEQETRLLRWDAELGFFAGERKFYAPSGFSYRTSFPYGGPALGGSVFPFGAPGSWVNGFGLVGAFQLGIVQAEFSGQTSTFTATDILGDIDLAYQVAISGQYGTRFTILVGGGLRFFDAPSSSGLASTDRPFYPDLGLTIEQPIVPHYLRLTAGFSYIVIATQGSAGQTAFGSSSGSGLDWTAGLAGRIFGALGWEAQVLQYRFSDSYAGGAGSGADIYTSYRVLLTLQH
jgi:hypothetical protein